MTRINISANDPSTIDWKTGAKAAEEKLEKAALAQGRLSFNFYGLKAERAKRDALAAELDKVRGALRLLACEEHWGRCKPGMAFQECEGCRETSSQDNPGWAGIKHVKDCPVGEAQTVLSSLPGDLGREIVAEWNKYREALMALKREASYEIEMLSLEGLKAHVHAVTSKALSTPVAEAGKPEAGEK